jgi:hypothetical protein
MNVSSLSLVIHFIDIDSNIWEPSRIPAW